MKHCCGLMYSAAFSVVCLNKRVSCGRRRSKKGSWQAPLCAFGDPDGIQTHDLQNRNLTLYSAKLRGPVDAILV